MQPLVLDEQVAGKRLLDGLRARGIEASSVGDFGVTGRADPDVLRTIDSTPSQNWVFVTMDLTIVEDHPGFDWNRYAIAWILVHQRLTGAAFEASKTDIVHRHAHQMLEQGRGAHHTYSAKSHTKTRPSLASQLRRRL